MLTFGRAPVLLRTAHRFMYPIPGYFIILTGLSLHVLWHQHNHINEVTQFRAALPGRLLALVNISTLVGVITFLGLTICFCVKFGLLCGLKFIALALLVQFLATFIISVLRLQKHGWAISLAGIVLLPVFAVVMMCALISIWSRR